MAVITTDGINIACDSALNGMYQETLVDVPVFYHGDFIYGCAGDTSAIVLFKQWVLEPNAAPDVMMVSEEFEALALHRDGYILSYGASLTPLRINAPAATGTGGKIAIGALHAGASAEEAVRIVIRLDPFSCGPVHTFNHDSIVTDQNDTRKMISDLDSWQEAQARKLRDEKGDSV